MTYVLEDMERAYVRGYLDGYDVEDPKPIVTRTARRMFSEWHSVEYTFINRETSDK